MTTEEKDLPVREKSSQKGAILTKVPKGTRDWFGADIQLRDEIFEAVTKVFKAHGGTPLDTPVFERLDILQGKYGEDGNQLIYALKETGGELLALKYDCTIPLARWLAMNNVQQITRYTCSKVYRRDQPAIARGRMREFWQMDIDWCGSFDPMIPDAEVLSVLVEAFTALGLDKEITIKINHRKILDGLFRVVGVPEEKIRSISSAVDKLDKSPWDEIRREMVEEKGLRAEVADEIGRYVQHHGDLSSICNLLEADSRLCEDAGIKEGLADMKLLQTYAEAFGTTHKLFFDLSLARGLDYYTGLIYEAVIELPSPTSGKGGAETRIGSIAAGGRYDNLVGMFGKKQIPCVGVSFGVDRIFTILKARRAKEANGQLRDREMDVYVMSFGGKTGLLPERMAIATELRAAGLRTEYMAKLKPKLGPQFKIAEDLGVRVCVIVAPSELESGGVKVKQMGLPDGHPEKEGRLVPRAEMVSAIKKLL